MFSILVHYKLTEYLDVVSEVVSHKLGKKVAEKWYWKVPIYLIGTPVYLYKSFREGQCHFVFSEVGFERKSKSGTSKLMWGSVGKVVKLNCCYLLVGKSDGMAPIPLRCLTTEQVMLLENWVGDKLTYEL